MDITTTTAATIERPEFTAVRVITRTVKGVKTAKTMDINSIDVLLKGNKAELEALLTEECLTRWDKHQYGVLAKTFCRVFPTLTKTIDARNAALDQIRETDPNIKGLNIDLGRLNKASTLAMMAVAVRIAGATSTGEKAKLVGVAHAINTAESELKARLALQAKL